MPTFKSPSLTTLPSPTAVTKDLVHTVRQEAKVLTQRDGFEWIHPLMNQVVLHNRVLDWLIALLVLAVAYCVLRLVQKLLIVRVANWMSHRKNWLGVVSVLLRSISPLYFLALAASLGGLALHVSKPVGNFLTLLPLLATLVQLALFVPRIVTSILEHYAQNRPDPGARLTMRMLIPPLQVVGVMILWSLLALLGLDKLGFNVTALVAGLGIGGVALGLAMQSILTNLLAAVSIVIDKPFVLGDMITVGDFTGIVENIGLKTTRLRSLGGEEVIFPNNDLLASRIRNYKSVAERRVVLPISILFTTPPEKVKALVGWIESIIKDQGDKVRFDRVHLTGVELGAYVYEAVFFVTDPDYNVYMTVKQTVWFEIMDRLSQEGIRFAQPTQVQVVADEVPAMAG
jgi:small-conductance mechanosensitive channel